MKCLTSAPICRINYIKSETKANGREMDNKQ
jgi:hypothetical protein